MWNKPKGHLLEIQASKEYGTHKGKGQKRKDRKESMSAPSCKGTPLQECGRPWCRGYGNMMT